MLDINKNPETLRVKFSVVITTFNRWQLLERAIFSALQQTIPCEVIVVDDASNDGTEKQIKELLVTYSERLVYYRLPKNLGHSAAVNQGVKLAMGDWIKLVDDDDYLAINCLEELSNIISHYSQAVIRSMQAFQVDESGQEISRTRKVGQEPVVYIKQEDIHYGMLLELVPFGTPIQVSFRRDVFLETKGWDSQLDTNYDDIDSWIKIAKFGDAIFINHCLGYRTVWAGGLNQKFSIVDRLKVNIWMKARIYQLVSPKYKSQLPSLDTIQTYLRLHWGLVALKQKQFSTAFSLLFPALFSPRAWQLLWGRKQQGQLTQKIYQRLPENI